LQDGRLIPVSAPDKSAGIRYGLDAARLPLWLGTGCPAEARRLSASWWRNVLSAEDRAAYLALSLTGAPMDRTTHPVPLLAGAAAAAAAGDRNRATTLHERAVQESMSQPTYYGSAWVALAGGLDDGVLIACKQGG
jgi:endoglucanase